MPEQEFLQWLKDFKPNMAWGQGSLGFLI
jgi:hypothetical protein